MWKQNREYFLPYFSLQLQDSHVSVTEGDRGMKYEILSVLSLITEDVMPRSPTPSTPNPLSPISSHLLLHTTHNLTGEAWFCFNDYCITETTLEDTLAFTDDWRSPICLVYQCKDFPEDSLTPLLTAPSRLPPPPFYSSSSLGAPDAPQTFRMLPPESLPGKGDLVSIDCEFIALNCEQVMILIIVHNRRILLQMDIVLFVKRQICN